MDEEVRRRERPEADELLEFTRYRNRTWIFTSLGAGAAVGSTAVAILMRPGSLVRVAQAPSLWILLAGIAGLVVWLRARARRWARRTVAAARETEWSFGPTGFVHDNGVARHEIAWSQVRAVDETPRLLVFHVRALTFWIPKRILDADALAQVRAWVVASGRPRKAWPAIAPRAWAIVLVLAALVVAAGLPAQGVRSAWQADYVAHAQFAPPDCSIQWTRAPGYAMLDENGSRYVADIAVDHVPEGGFSRAAIHVVMWNASTVHEYPLVAGASPDGVLEFHPLDKNATTLHAGDRFSLYDTIESPRFAYLEDFLGDRLTC